MPGRFGVVTFVENVPHRKLRGVVVLLAARGIPWREIPAYT
jgi:hypothetical protein